MLGLLANAIKPVQVERFLKRARVLVAVMDVIGFLAALMSHIVTVLLIIFHFPLGQSVVLCPMEMNIGCLPLIVLVPLLPALWGFP